MNQNESPGLPTDRGTAAGLDGTDEETTADRERLEGVVSAEKNPDLELTRIGETVDNVLAHLANLQDDHDQVKTGLWDKTQGLDRHCANLQESHDEIKRAVWSNTEQLARLEKLWLDTQRDLSVLAEAFSRLGDD